MLLRIEGRLVFDPSEYPGRLVVEFDCGNAFGDEPHPECGVFAGRSDELEPGQLMSEIPVEEPAYGVRRFEIVAPNLSKSHRLWQYHYLVVWWHPGVYLPHAKPTEVMLQDSGGSWSVWVGNTTMILPDYRPWS